MISEQTGDPLIKSFMIALSIMYAARIPDNTKSECGVFLPCFRKHIAKTSLGAVGSNIPEDVENGRRGRAVRWIIVGGPSVIEG